MKTKSNPEWINWISSEQFNDQDLFKIVIFYVFHTPCSQLSCMGKSLSDYGWHNPWKKPYFLNRQLRQASSAHQLIYSAEKCDELDKFLSAANLKDNFPSDLSNERICIYDNKKNQFNSIFYHIRNALAHCRLNMVDVENECVFIFEDVASVKNSKDKEVRARMILKKSTLLKWIHIIENGEREYNKS